MVDAQFQKDVSLNLLNGILVYYLKGLLIGNGKISVGNI